MDSPMIAIRRHLVDYLAGTTSLDDLKERLIDATWDRKDAADSEAFQLAYDIELVLAEASSGYLTPEEMRADLRQLVDRAAVHAHT